MRPEAVFIFMSTNKVYGDAPNEVPLVETPTRWEYARPEDYQGITEKCRIDQCMHSLFGASKVAADVLAQEYGRYFGMKTGTFRGGCLTGANHSGVELHGFLSYLVKVAVRTTIHVFGYKGKQVRDQIHSADVIAAFDAFAADPRPGEVYNLGGGRENSVSMLEAFPSWRIGWVRPVRWQYELAEPPGGSHLLYLGPVQAEVALSPVVDHAQIGRHPGRDGGVRTAARRRCGVSSPMTTPPGAVRSLMVHLVSSCLLSQ